MPETELTIWQPDAAALQLAPTADVPAMAEAALQLTPREKTQVVSAFAGGSYELATSYVWNKTLASLKKTLVSVGVRFLGEMVGLVDATDEQQVLDRLTEKDAIRLGRELGVVTTSDAMRLEHASELLAYLYRQEGEEGLDPSAILDADEAKTILKACVRGVLGKQSIGVAREFAEFRKKLEEQVLTSADPEVVSLQGSPYFFKKLTVSILLSIIKGHESGAELEKALGNFNIFIPELWHNLSPPEKWQIGQAYAEMHNKGRSQAVSSMAKALMKVKGFDFVPENLRSNTFIQTAQRVLRTHYALNNFHNEPGVLSQLQSLGSSIPQPALQACMKSLICTYLGNAYGPSWAGIPYSEQMLATISQDRWIYYLDECLPHDSDVLTKLQSGKCQGRWPGLVTRFELASLTLRGAIPRELVQAGAGGDLRAVKAMADMLLKLYYFPRAKRS